MSAYDITILVVFVIFALDIVGPRLYQLAAWWFDHEALHDEEDEEPDKPAV